MDEMKRIKEKYVKEKNVYINESKKYSNLRLIMFLAITAIGLANFKKLLTFPYLLIEIILIVCFIAIVMKESSAEKNKRRAENIINIVETYEKRENGQWIEFAEKGDLFLEEYSYLSDLQILGDNSLYQFVNCAQTLGGKKKLAEKFKCIMKKEAKSIENDAKIYQSTVEELANDPNFIVAFQEKISNITEIENMDAENEKDTFKLDKKFSNIDFSLSIVLSIITIATAILSKFYIQALLVLIPLVFIQFVSAAFYQNRYSKEILNIGKKVKKLKEMQDLCGLLASKKFNCEKLKQLSNQLIASSEVYKKMKKIDALESFRRNFLMWFIGNVFFSLNRFIVFQYSKIENKDKEVLYNAWLAIEEMEVIISLATINIVKKVTCRPVFNQEIRLKIESVKHPMLVENKCIPNDFQSNKSINIITGSNMSGKTSFMKTIGVNLVLAYAGGYVNSEEFQVPILKIYTSINVKDDINKGISKFYGELLRLKEAITGTENKEKIICFIDEIFSGTNYQDRIYGAKNIIQRLSNEKLIGFITTHDFELCEIEKNIKNIKNYHFAEEYIDGKMHFSHKIKEGKCNGTNAIQLMKKTGILSEIQEMQ